MNKLLKEQNLGYMVDAGREKEPPRQTYWIVVKFDWKFEKSEAE